MSRPPVPPHLRKPRNGRTIKEAAQITGLTEQTIKRWTSEPREVYLRRVQERREAIRTLKTEHPELTVRAIAERIGCSIGTVHNALKEAV